MNAEEIAHQESKSFSFETTKVQFCADPLRPALEIDGQKLVADAGTAFVEFHLCHAFPVVNNYRTAIHPQVLSNSYQSLRWKCFNLAHMMRAHSVDNPRDRILGFVAGVEFPGKKDEHRTSNTEHRTSKKPWTIDYSRGDAPGMRAVAGMFKYAEGVPEILRTYASGTTPWGDEWTVSIENISTLVNSGFLVKGTVGVAPEDVADTPADLAALGYAYVPCLTAPLELLRCLNDAADDARDGMESRRVCRRFAGQETLLLLGGLDGEVFFNGVGLTPGGAQEAEARVSQMLAGERFIQVGADLLPDFFAPLRKLLGAVGEHSQ